MSHRKRSACRALCLVWFAMAAPLQMARASDAEDLLRQLYQVDIEVSACKDVQISSADQSKLDDAIDVAEQKSGLDEAARQAVYDAIEADAQKDISAFCKAGSSSLSATLQGLPKP